MHRRGNSQQVDSGVGLYLKMEVVVCFHTQQMLPVCHICLLLSGLCFENLVFLENNHQDVSFFVIYVRKVVDK